MLITISPIVVLIVVLIVAIMGGIYGGFFTPTEASAVGAILDSASIMLIMNSLPMVIVLLLIIAFPGLSLVLI